MTNALTLASVTLALAACSSNARAASDDPSNGTGARKLTFTTFNIRYFGTGGTLNGTPSDEKREETIRKFIATEVPRTDVFSFQEIVDVELLKKVVPTGYECLSYEHPNPKHQHVVVCVAPALAFDHEPTDDNDLIDEVAIDPKKSRPALHVRIRDKATGTLLTRVVAVHLKAYPQESKTRQSQSEIIGRYLRDLKSEKLPTVLLGDINTYPSPSNKESEHDDALIDRALKKFGLGLVQASNPAEFTYRSERQRGHFDRFWVSESLRQVGQATVFSACNQADTATGRDFTDAKYYYDFVSDHCPVTMTLQY